MTSPDWLGLESLPHAYAALVDDRRFAEATALFTSDGVLATPKPPKHLDPVNEAVGHDEIETALRALEPIPVSQHALVGVHLEPDSDTTATGRVACQAHHFLGDGTDLVWHLVYRDAYRLTDQGWRFTRRSLHVQAITTQPVTVQRQP